MMSMNTNNSQNFDFIILLVLILTGLGGFLLFGHQPGYQVMIVGLTGAGYVLWGIWHHQRWGNFYWQVILEYFLVGALVTVLTWSLLI